MEEALLPFSVAERLGWCAEPLSFCRISLSSGVLRRFLKDASPLLFLRDVLQQDTANCLWTKMYSTSFATRDFVSHTQWLTLH